MRLAQDLVNRMPQAGWTIGDLRSVLDRAFVRGAHVDDRAVDAITALTGRLRAVFTARHSEPRVALVNELLAGSVQTVRIETHDGLPLHLHFASPGGRLERRVTAMTAGGLAVFIVEAGGDRLGACARAGCDTVFADTSRNGRRSYCSARCGNLAAVHRYRDQRRERA